MTNNPSLEQLVELYREKKYKDVVELGKSHCLITDQHTVLNIVGSAELALGNLKSALEYYQKAIQLKPTFAEALSNIGVVLNKMGRYEDAVGQLKRSVSLMPEYSAALFNLGISYDCLGKYKESITCYEKVISIQPDYLSAYLNLGAALGKLGFYTEGIKSLNKVLNKSPDFISGYFTLAKLHKDCDQHEEAVACYAAALKINPNMAEIYSNMGVSLNALGKYSEAISSYQRAIKINPGHVYSYSNIGVSYNELGMIEEAKASLSKAIELKPDYIEAYRNLGGIKKYNKSDPQINKLLEIYKNKNDLKSSEKEGLCFALAKIYGDLKDYDRQFQFLIEGNGLIKESIKYDIRVDVSLFSKIRAYFSQIPETFKLEPETEELEHKPIFIVGMPRSGTTLVEQILSSHSLVHGAGELEIVSKILQQNAGYLNILNKSVLTEIRKLYFEGISRLGVSEKYVVDKMPLNFRWLGFILCAIPEAKIIHIKRQAAATCWSIYSKKFNSTGNKYAYDLQDLGNYYNLYTDLMKFWNNKYPGRIFNMSYESMTENQEKSTRELLSYVGLPWEDSCLEFEKNTRAIKTASSFQVRNKMYQGSSRQWLNYKKNLKPLLDVLYTD